MGISNKGEKVYIYKHTLNYFLSTIGIPGFIILSLTCLTSGEVGYFLLAIGLSIGCYLLRKIEHEGVEINLNTQILSYPQFSLSGIVKPFVRKEILISEIQKVSGYTNVEIKDNKIKQVHDLTIYGTFGYEKFRFYTIEERNQFYTLLSSIGNFETIG
jgi:hypothetical protein